MITSSELNLIGKALADVNEILANPKNTAQNPFFKSKYAPLNDILTDIRPLFAQHGLTILQNTLSLNDMVGIQTMILHVSGQYIQSDILFLKADKDTAQGQGSSITYGRRYQLSGMLNIASEDDDDGNHASSKQATKATPPVLKNAAGEIEVQKGNQKKAMDKLVQCKTEQHIQQFLDLRAKSTWTPEELKEQDEKIKLIRSTWAKEAQA